MTTTFPPPYRALAVLAASFAAALAAFLLLRGAEPAPRPGRGPPPPSGAGAAAHGRADRAAPGGAARRPRARARSARRSPTRTSSKARETGDPGFYARADGLLRGVLAARPGDPDALVRASASLALSRHDFRGGRALAAPRRGRAARRAGAASRVLVDARVELGRFGAAERTLQRLHRRQAGARGLRARRPTCASCTATSTAPPRRCGARSRPAAPARESGASVQALLGGLELQRGRPARGAARPPRRARRRPGLPGGRGRAGAAGRGARRPARAAIRRWRALVGAAAAAGVRDRARRGAAGRRARRAAGRRELALVGAEQRLLAGGVNTDAELAVFEADHGDPARAVALARRAWRAAPGRPRRRRARLGADPGRPARGRPALGAPRAAARQPRPGPPLPRGDRPRRRAGDGGRRGARAARARRLAAAGRAARAR